MILTPDIQRIRDSLSDQEQEIFDTVVRIAGKVNAAFQNKMQWQKPTFTLSDNWHHWIFSLAKTKMGITMSFPRLAVGRSPNGIERRWRAPQDAAIHGCRSDTERRGRKN